MFGAKKKFDKLVKGLIIGSAIGSIVGMSIAPKTGKETRRLLRDRSKSLFKKGKAFLEKTDYVKKGQQSLHGVWRVFNILLRGKK